MKINRLFEIMYILLDKKSISASELASRFEVSERTIYRDIDVLCEAGIPVYTIRGRDGGISLMPNFILNKTLLTEIEKADIISALQATVAVSLDNVVDVEDKTLQKLLTLFGSSNLNSDWIEINFSSWGNAIEEKVVWSSLKYAIINKTMIKFTYSNAKGETNSRTVEPLKLCFKNQSWYLYGYCTLKDDFRFFKLRRIKDLLILESNFERSVPKQVFTDENVFKEEVIELKLKLSHNMAFRIYDEFSKITVLPDGKFEVIITMPKGEWMFSYIMSFGEDCEIIKPNEVKYEIKERLQKILCKYL